MNHKKSIIIITFLLSTLLLKAQDSLHLYTVFHGENDKDQFGVVENVGDVNGDGFEDLMVGAPAHVAGAASEVGYANLYFGGTQFDTLPDMTFRSYEELKGGFGYTIAGNGDLNGDGYSDFVIANPYFGDMWVGKVYVYFGGPQLDTIPNLMVTLDPNGYFYTLFGLAITMSGDINKDGFDDLVVGAPIDDWDRHGEVFIYYGGKDMNTIPDVNIIYPMPLQTFGRYLDYMSDANGDGIDDLLIGSDPVDSDTTTFIFWGNSLGNIGFSNYYSFTKPISGIVSALGDINDDGYSDFAVGDKIFLSPIRNNVFQELIILNKDHISFSIKSGIPDLNNDNHDEFICLYRKGKVENIFIVPGGEITSINNAIVINDPDDKSGFGRYITSFSSLFSNNVVSLIIGDQETIYSTDHGTGKVFIYNRDVINNVGFDDGVLDVVANFDISQNYPNPFNPSTTIKWKSSAPSHTMIKVFDILGKEIAVLINNEIAAGQHQIEFNAEEYKLSSGVYFINIKVMRSGSEVYTENKKVILMK